MNVERLWTNVLREVWNKTASPTSSHSAQLIFLPLIFDGFTAWGKRGNNRQDARRLTFPSFMAPERRPLFVRAAGSKLIRNSRHRVVTRTPGLVHLIPLDDLYQIITNRMETTCLQFPLETHLFSLMCFLEGVLFHLSLGCPKLQLSLLLTQLIGSQAEGPPCAQPPPSVTSSTRSHFPKPRLVQKGANPCHPCFCSDYKEGNCVKGVHPSVRVHRKKQTSGPLLH